MLESPTDTDAAKKALVRTYRSPSYADPWDAVLDYERVQTAAAKHPAKKSSALSRVVNLPRQRIRAWVDGDGTPDCYRSLQTALDRGWIIDSWTSERARGLNELAAWTAASGSIDEAWRVSFVADPQHVERLEAAASRAGIRLRSTRDDPHRPPEWTPRENVCVLGRVLHTWTGFRGDKSRETTRFPRYPFFSPREVAREFCATYVRLRGTERADQPHPYVQVQEARTASYRESFVELLERVVSDAENIRGDSWPIGIRDAAVAELYGDDGVGNVQPAGQ